MTSVIRLDGTLDFGKYAGKSVMDVLGTDPNYLLFLRRPSRLTGDGKPMRDEGTPMCMDLHMALDATLYSNGWTAQGGYADKPKFPRDQSDKWLAELDSKVQSSEAAVVDSKARAEKAYGASWGAW